MNYERLIIASLPGATPKEKFERLMAIQKHLVNMLYPARGSEYEQWDAYQFADAMMPHFHDHVTVVNNPELDFKELL